MTEVLPEESISIMANPMPTTAVEIRSTILSSNGGADSPTGTDSPGTSQMSPPPSYYDIPGKHTQICISNTRTLIMHNCEF